MLVVWDNDSWMVKTRMGNEFYLVHPTLGWGQKGFRTCRVSCDSLYARYPSLADFADIHAETDLHDLPEELYDELRNGLERTISYERAHSDEDPYAGIIPAYWKYAVEVGDAIEYPVGEPVDKTNHPSHQTYESGYMRENNEDKLRVDLIPIDMIRRMGKRFGEGSKKYSERNWEKANPLNREEMDRFKASAFRHLLAWMNDEQDEDHAAAVAVNVCMYEDVMLKYNNGLSTQE